jgi:hypothetical protein
MPIIYDESQITIITHTDDTKVKAKRTEEEVDEASSFYEQFRSEELTDWDKLALAIMIELEAVADDSLFFGIWSQGMEAVADILGDQKTWIDALNHINPE